MINLDNIDRPAILAEVTAAFYQYEDCLLYTSDAADE